MSGLSSQDHQTARCGRSGTKENTLFELAYRVFPPKSWPSLPSIRWEIVDTNVLLKNIGKDVDRYPQLTAMRLLGELGALRLFAPPHVDMEMEERIDEWMVLRGRDPNLGRRIWEIAYKPAIRFVDTGSYAGNDARLVSLRSRDPDDMPTAALAIMLGRKALSEDRDLIDSGLGTGRPWLALVLATGHAALGESVQVGVAGAVGVTSQGIVDLVRAADAMSATPRGRRLLIGVGLLLVGIAVFGIMVRRWNEPGRHWIDDTARSAKAALKDGGRVIVGGYLDVERNRRTGEVTLRAGVVASRRPPAVIELAARILASASEPMSSPELARRIWGYERAPRAKTVHVHEVLAGLPAFVAVESDMWVLGRPGTAGPVEPN